MKKNECKKMRRKALCIALSAAMVLELTGCGKEEAEQAAVITNENQEQVLEKVLNGQVSPSHSSQAGKEETVYVLADAKGGVNQVIVSDWLKNGGQESSLADCSDLKDIQNVKGYETFETDEKGNILWKAEGADIYYQGTTEKEVPVEVKISYQLDGRDISPEELAGKSGRVKIRLDYENKETRKVKIGQKEQEIKVPFAMISGMVLPQDVFSNIEVTNARLLSEGNNSVVVGVAFPGLQESIDVESMKDKVKEKEEKEKLEEIEIPDYMEVEADADHFELGMTMTVAMSDILSDIELTDSFDLSNLQDSMEELQEASDQLKDGTLELKDGSGQLKDGTGKLLTGTDDLLTGARELKDGTQELYEKSGILNEGAGQLDEGAGQLDEGAEKLASGAGELNQGAEKLANGAVQVDEGVSQLSAGAGKVNEGASELYQGTEALQEGAQRLSVGTNALQDGGSKLAAGTGSLVDGAKNLNEGAHHVKDGVDQVAVQMGMLQALVGTPVDDGTSLSADQAGTLLQLSYLLNQSLREASIAVDGLSEQSYGEILANLQQKAAQTQENLDAANANLSVAQERSTSAEAQIASACQMDTQEMQVVTDTHSEEKEVEVSVEAPVYTTTRIISEGTEEEEGGILDETTDVDTQIVTGTGVVTTEVVDTDTVQIQTVDTDNLQEKIDEYKNALGDVAACQAEVNAYSMQLTALNEEMEMISAHAGDQEALKEKWGPAITYGAYLEASLQKLSAQLADQSGMAALVQGADSLASGTENALLGATELDHGANELKSGIDNLNGGAGELAAGVGNLKAGAAALKGGTNDLANGAAALKGGTGELRNGTETLKSGTGELANGASSLKDGAASLKNGTGELKDGTEQLAVGTNTLNNGAGTLKDGVSSLKEGVLTLEEGMESLDEGALALVDGMFEFDEEGISRLTEMFGEDVQDVVDRLTAVADAGRAYNTFTKLPENTEGNVKFIIKTEGVKE